MMRMFFGLYISLKSYIRYWLGKDPFPVISLEDFMQKYGITEEELKKEA